MTLPKKNSRPIEVDAVPLRYVVSVSKASEAGLLPMNLTVDFQTALDRMLIEDFADEALEEAKICVIKRPDKPLSPYLEAVRSWTLQQRGITTGHRQAFRQGMLGCSLAQVRVAVQRWLIQGPPSRAAAVGNEGQDLSGLQPLDLLAMAG